MTITGTDLLAHVRSELNDTDSTAFKWPDSELIVYANDAVRDYSQYFRIQKTTYLLVTDGTINHTKYLMPFAVIKIVRVGYEVGGLIHYLREKPYKRGEIARLPGQAVSYGTRIPRPFLMAPGRAWLGHYSISTDEDDLDAAVTFTIDFLPDVAGTMHIDYLVGHDLFIPAALSTPTTIPNEDEELLRLYVCAKAFMRRGGQESQLSQWRTREDGSRRDDSPIIPRENRLFNAYRQKLEDKLAHPRSMRLARRG